MARGWSNLAASILPAAFHTSEMSCDLEKMHPRVISHATNTDNESRDLHDGEVTSTRRATAHAVACGRSRLRTHHPHVHQLLYVDIFNGSMGDGSNAGK